MAALFGSFQHHHTSLPLDLIPCEEPGVLRLTPLTERARRECQHLKGKRLRGDVAAVDRLADALRGWKL